MKTRVEQNYSWSDGEYTFVVQRFDDGRWVNTATLLDKFQALSLAECLSRDHWDASEIIAEFGS